MKNRRSFIVFFEIGIIAVALAGSGGLVAAQDALEGAADDQRDHEFLTIGDPAPDLDIAHWLKGSEIESFQSGHVYVINFWATWCKFCQAEMPSLSRLQQDYEAYDVHVVGVSYEKLQTVYSFLQRGCWDQKTQYSIAADPDRSVMKAYMVAAAIGEVPTTFVVGREGVLEWIGHPSGAADVLRAVADNSWDRDSYRTEYEEDMAEAYVRARHMRKVRDAYRARDWERLLTVVDEAIAAVDDPSDLKVQRFLMMIGEMGASGAGYEYGRSVMKEYWDDARVLNQLAWFVAVTESVGERDLDFAMQAARRACELTDFESATLVDTFARVCYERGDLDTALKWQRIAVSDLLEEDNQFFDVIHDALDRYEREAHERDDARADDG